MTRRSLLPVAIAALAIAASSRARADAPPASPAPSDAPPIALAAAPIFGTDAATGNGWNEIVARVDNPGTTPRKGTLELAMAAGFGSDEMEPAARAPFAVPPGRSAIVALPMHGFSSYYAPQVVVAAKGEDGAKLASVTVAITGASSPLLVEIAQPARLGVALRGWPVPVASAASSPSSAGSTQLTTGAPSFDRATGDPILPERASGYAAATAVIVASDRLVGLEEARRDALVDWVNGGGTLAVAVARPEDLRSPVMRALVGGDATRTAPPARLFTLPAFAKPAAPSLLPSPEGEDDEEPPGTAPPGGGRGTAKAIRSGPSDALRSLLAGYEGARLHASDVGATAPCGLGEVHLLAFDPMQPPAIDDPWAQTRIVDMVGRAWDRRARVALPIGAGDRTPGRLDEVRRALDPNENFRLGLGVSAVLLVLYSIAVGPIVFTRAAKKGAPLLPLKWVPICSAAAFGAIVLVGLGIKGWRGRARHLTVLEAGSGASRAAMRSYRGFFASETRSLTVAASDRTAVLALASEGSGMRVEPGVLKVDRDGVTLGGLTSLPWQTVVVREDAVVDFKGGVVLAPAASGGFRIENRTGRTLKDVLLHAPKSSGVTYFTTIDDGETVDATRGRFVATIGGTVTTAGSLHVHPLGAREIPLAMTPRDGKRIADAWAPIEAAANDGTDWWPDDAPVMIAELVGGPRASRDAGLAVESDRVLVRVVGAVAK